MRNEELPGVSRYPEHHVAQHLPPYSVDVHQGLGTAQPVRPTGHSDPRLCAWGMRVCRSLVSLALTLIQQGGPRSWTWDLGKILASITRIDPLRKVHGKWPSCHRPRAGRGSLTWQEALPIYGPSREPRAGWEQLMCGMGDGTRGSSLLLLPGVELSH